MAVKISEKFVLSMVFLSICLLLSGCAEKNQAVSEEGKRPDFSIISSTSENAAVSTGEERDRTPVAPANPDTTNNTASDGTGSVKENRWEWTGAAEGKPEIKAGAKPAVSEETEGNANENLKPDSEKPQEDKSNEAVQQNSAPASSYNGLPVGIKFSEMYSGGSSRGLQFSEKLKSLNGKKVVITGYMAPPLKPSFTFFVLTPQPMAICPFCSTDASWPEDIILVYLPKGENRTPTDAVLTVTGTLELGSHTDPDTGFVSQARIYSDTIETVR